MLSRSARLAPLESRTATNAGTESKLARSQSASYTRWSVVELPLPPVSL